MYRKRLAVWPSRNAVKKLKFQFVEDGLNVLEVFRKGPRDRGTAGACQFSKFWPCERPHKDFRESVRFLLGKAGRPSRAEGAVGAGFYVGIDVVEVVHYVGIQAECRHDIFFSGAGL